MLAAGAIVAASINSDVKADDPLKGSLPVYDIEQIGRASCRERV